MIQIYVWSARGATLGLIAIFFGVITSIPIILWLREYRKVKGEISEDDDWLAEERNKVTHGQPNVIRAGIANLRNLTLFKKIVTLVLIGGLVFSVSWLAWEWGPFSSYTMGSYNDDTRVFIVADVNSDTREFHIRGIHNNLLDRRRCILAFMVPYTPMNQTKVNVTAEGNFECTLYAGVQSHARMRIGITLYSSTGNSIEDSSLWSEYIVNDTLQISSNYSSAVQFKYPLSAHTNYYYGIQMTVFLDGNSSIEGLQPGTPAVLKINNLTIIESPL